MENNRGLLNRIKAESVIGPNKSFHKIVILAVIGIVFAFLFGYFLKLSILESRLDSWLFGFLALIGFLTVFLLDVFFIKHLWKTNLIIFLESLAFLSPFYSQLSLIISGGALISFLIFLWANYNGYQELENMLEIKFWRIGKKTLPKAITVLALFTSLAYVGLVGPGEKEFFISQPTFEKIISPITEMKAIQGFVPGLDLSLTSGELFKNLARNQIEQNLQFRFLTKDAKNQLIEQTVNNLEKKVSEFLGSPINPQAKISEMVYETMVGRFNQLPAEIKALTPKLTGVLIFLIIVGLILPIRWLATFLAFIIYEICLAVGFSVIMMEGKSREIIVLK